MHSTIHRFLLVGLLGLATCLASSVVSRAATITLSANDPNSSVLLSDLLPGGQFDDGAFVGDKFFSDFFYATLPNDDMPPASQVQVFGFQDLNNNWGLSFHGAFTDLPGGGASDALLRFTVEVTPAALEQGYRISDAHLFIGGVGLGSNSFLAVDESFQGLNEILNTYATTLGGSQNQDLADEVFFDQLYTKLRVTKDILAIAGAQSDQPARLTVIDQSFSQTIIPEPSSVLMLSAAGFGLALSRRWSSFRNNA